MSATPDYTATMGGTMTPASTSRSIAPIDPGKQSKSRLRELAGAVERLQDQLEELDGQRKEKRKQITVAIRDWNTEASKRK